MELKVFTNPAEQSIVIEIGISQPATFKLFDDLGKLVLFTEVSDKQHLLVSHLEAGLYHYKLISDTRLQAGKIRLGE